MTETTMGSAEVAKLLNVEFRTLHGWRERGLLTPRQIEGNGPKRAVVWTAKDIKEARTVAALRTAGFSTQGIAKAQAYLRSLGYNPFSTGKVAVVLGTRGQPKDLIKIVDQDTAFKLLRERGQLVMLALDPEEGGATPDLTPSDK